MKDVKVGSFGQGGGEAWLGEDLCLFSGTQERVQKSTTPIPPQGLCLYFLRVGMGKTMGTHKEISITKNCYQGLKHSLGDDKLFRIVHFQHSEDSSVIFEEESIQMDLKKYVFMNTKTMYIHFNNTSQRVIKWLLTT